MLKTERWLRKNRFIKRSEYAPLFRVFKTVDYPAAEKFFEGVASGIGLYEGSPLLAVRNTFLKESTKVTRRLSPKERLAILIIGWNKYIEGKEVSKIHWDLDSSFPSVKGLNIDKEKESRQHYAGL